jgi:restriction system protein
MGYTARVTPRSGDGGVDVVAHKDALGFEPPIIKVQCKRISATTGEADVNQLLGTLGEGEFGLYVSASSYSRNAILLERNRSKLRLIDGAQLVEVIIENYDRLAPRYRALIPLRQIFVPDLAPT